jgi:predicted ATPase
MYNKKRGLTQFYNGVKQSIDREIVKCREHLGEYDISIEAGLRFSPAFFDEFLKFINQSAVGSFRGQEEGRAMLRRLSDSVTDWEEEGEVFNALDAIVEALHTDKRDEVSPQNAARDVFKQMKGQRPVQELYDYLFGFDYLGTKYDLKVDQKDLSELSPGERGGLLLVFYLMLDRQDIPLVIDQPEDNLDNKSVYEILVTFIKQAKTRRQIILVTHNPNLAVVADAEQIIHVSIDKKDGKHDFDFFSGSIEDARINRAVVDILEGTLPAFDNRRLKYRKQAGIRDGELGTSSKFKLKDLQ